MAGLPRPGPGHEDGGITVTDDGRTLTDEEIGKALAYGEPVPSADAGMTLANVRMLARSLDWTVTVEATGDGLRVRFDGVTVT